MLHLDRHLCRLSKQFSKDDREIPAELFFKKNAPAKIDDIKLPLPSRRQKYYIGEELNGVRWLAADNGVTRYEPNAKNDFDRIMFFSASRDIPDNNVESLMPVENGCWVLTFSGCTFIEIKELTCEEMADILLKETQTYVDRRGMVSQKELAVPGDVTTAVRYGHSDNSGTFTACFAVGELFRYAVKKRELGEDAPETIEAKRAATRAVEAVLLLEFIPCRGDGFVARTYLTKDEPVPDDGYFLKIENGVATVLDTTCARNNNLVGKTVKADVPVPERLRHLYTDEGYTENDLTYKADTSSDEITHHFLMLYYAHHILGDVDTELDEIIKLGCKNMMKHIIDNGYILRDFTGECTTWARWYPDYFVTPDGYVDACLNSAELLMYLKVTMDITGEGDIWEKEYNHLINDLGYADYTYKHFDRLYQMTLANNSDFSEDIMYGDHMLATYSLWGLCMLEKDEALLEKYKAAFKTWRSSIAREFNPGYDYPYLISCPGEDTDWERIKEWFYRANISRLASGVSVEGRHDVACRVLRNDYKETSYLLPQDERYISKYDRNTIEYKNVDSGGEKVLESCYVYTFAYWMGRYYGFND